MSVPTAPLDARSIPAIPADRLARLVRAVRIDSAVEFEAREPAFVVTWSRRSAAWRWVALVVGTMLGAPLAAGVSSESLGFPLFSSRAGIASACHPSPREVVLSRAGASVSPGRATAGRPESAAPKSPEEQDMRKFARGSWSAVAGVALVAGVVSMEASAQDAVQWRVEDGGNGHWYRAARELEGGSFLQWSQWAGSLGGHLATMSNVAEHQFILDVATSQDGLWSAFGCYRDAGSTQWRWVTGESVSYAPWAPGEPNAPISTAAFTQLWGSGGIPNLTWDDNNTPTGIGGVIVEWSADCNSDGVVDYGQIRAGELEDANANNIPDCCEDGVSCVPCLADIDESGTVSGVDLAAMLGVWGTDGGKYPRADIDGSGTVDAGDLAILLNSWGPCQ
jgi:hypothetical protein